MDLETAPEKLFFLVEDDALRDDCHEWRRRVDRFHDTAIALAHKHKGVSYEMLGDGTLFGILTKHEPPAGWMLFSEWTRPDLSAIVPCHGEVGDHARSDIDSLPKLPTDADLSKIFGISPYFRYRFYKGSESYTMRIDQTLTLLSRNGSFVLETYNPYSIQRDYQDRYHAECEIIEGYWNLRDGLRLITADERQRILEVAA